MAGIPDVTLKGLKVETIGNFDWFSFTWEGEELDWQEALRRLKDWVPSDYRGWNAKSKRWFVRTDLHDVEIALAGIFPNFRGALEALRSQLAMF